MHKTKVMLGPQGNFRLRKKRWRWSLFTMPWAFVVWAATIAERSLLSAALSGSPIEEDVFTELVPPWAFSFLGPGRCGSMVSISDIVVQDGVVYFL